jgi:hypothetical protein
MKEHEALVKPFQDEIARIEAPHRARILAAKMAKLSEEAQEAHRTPVEKRTPAQKELVEKTNRQLGISVQEVARSMTPEERSRHKELQEEVKKRTARKPAPLAVAMGLQDAEGDMPRTFLLERGELGHPVREVQAGFPSILLAGNVPVPAPAATLPVSISRRSALARWLASPENPLTARVLVNRLWQHHFGRGIVATASDFGLRGERPSHPELLDWLAQEFVEQGWSLKRLHRLMLTSAAYRQSTQAGPETLVKDPDNRLFSRMNRLRLEGEAVRDSLLAVSGRLNAKMGGPGVFPAIPPEALVGFKGWTASPDRKDHVRRSVYVFARRNLRFPFLEAFDLPDSNLSCPKRERSTTAPQALALLNAVEVEEAATAFARGLEERAADPRARVELAYRLALGRAPTLAEQQACLDFLRDSPLAELCRALFNLNEFVYLD